MKSLKLGGFALTFLLVFAFTLTGFVSSLDAQSVELQYPDDDPDVDSRWLPTHRTPGAPATTPVTTNRATRPSPSSACRPGPSPDSTCFVYS